MSISKSPVSPSEGAHASDSDAAHLDKLGYKSEFKRDMSPWANFSLGFTYLSRSSASTRCSPTHWPPAARR